MTNRLHTLFLGAAAAALVVLASGCAGPGGQAPGAAPRERQTESDTTDLERRSRVRLELAMAYFSRGQFDVALDEVKLALATNPNSADAYTVRGLIYGALNEDRLAEDSYVRALQLDAGNANAMHNYGWFLCERKRYPEADAQFEHAVAQPRYAGVPRTLMTMGVCQQRAQRLPEAERSLSRSYELDPSNPVTALNLAEVLYKRGDYERARFYARRANGVAGFSNAQSLWLAARIEHRIGNAGGAREFGLQLRARFPKAPEALRFEQGLFDD